METNQLIALLHTFPQNESEVGFNSGIITIMKLSSGIDDNSRENLKLYGAVGRDIYNTLSTNQIAEMVEAKLNGNKLLGVKLLKEATGQRLKESKDMMDKFYAMN